MESKGLRVNVGKTKVMKCQVAANMQVESGKYLCGICGKGVGRNLIQCGGCKKWVHKKCSGVKGKLKEDSGYRCAKCVGGCGSEKGVDEQEVVLEDAAVWSVSKGFVTWVTRWKQQGAVEKRPGLKSKGPGVSSTSLQRC